MVSGREGGKQDVRKDLTPGCGLRVWPQLDPTGSPGARMTTELHHLETRRLAFSFPLSLSLAVDHHLGGKVSSPS